MIRALFKPILIVAASALLNGCTDDAPQGRPAPLGERGVLEQLAHSYTGAAEDLPVRPDRLTAEDRKRFVQQVFADAGYDYGTTLQALSRSRVDSSEQLHKDLVELLFLPHAGSDRETMARIYNQEELNAIARIQDQINSP